MRWSAAEALFAALVLGVAGCRSCDRVETELRAREEDVRTLKDSVERLSCTNQILERELAAHRGDIGPDGLLHAPHDLSPVRSLVVSRQTAGRPGCDGHDDGILVVLEPRDCENQAIKVTGGVTIELLERPLEGESRLIDRWEISPDELRQTWQNGLFSTGYKLSLPFKTRPATDRLRVVARLRMSNGRVFENDHTFTVRLGHMPMPGRAAPLISPSAPVNPHLVIPHGEYPKSQSPLLPPTAPPIPVFVPPWPMPLPNPAPVSPAPITPEKRDTLPAPTPLDDDVPKKPEDGPILTRTGSARPVAELLPPVSITDEEEEH